MKQTRLLLRVPAGAPNAIGAWEAVTPKHRHDTAPPVGVPVFWAVGRHGHVALSAGHGLVWSIDIRRPGRLDPVWIEEFHRSWGADLLGWTDRLNGVPLV